MAENCSSISRHAHGVAALGDRDLVRAGEQVLFVALQDVAARGGVGGEAVDQGEGDAVALLLGQVLLDLDDGVLALTHQVGEDVALEPFDEELVVPLLDSETGSRAGVRHGLVPSTEAASSRRRVGVGGLARTCASGSAADGAGPANRPARSARGGARPSRRGRAVRTASAAAASFFLAGIGCEPQLPGVALLQRPLLDVGPGRQPFAGLLEGVLAVLVDEAFL
jgi:hypothetical protein